MIKKIGVILVLCIISVSLVGQSRRAYKKAIKEHRKHYKADFLKEERSPFYGKEAALKDLDFYKANRKYNVPCTFLRTADAQPFDMATYSGKVKQFVQYGILKFQLDGKQHQLSVYRNLTLIKIEAYRDHLFVPFKDSTSDVDTYGGGRYIDLMISDVSRENIMLDFNKCYNPWCAFSSGYNCPVPPKENHLSTAIKAGERKYKGKNDPFFHRSNATAP